MSKVSSRSRIYSILTSVLALSVATATLAADKAPAPTKETREKMAVLHEHMAACLRSDKSISECHTEMMHDCRADLGKQGCPMMEMGHGMTMKHKMQPTESK